MIFPIINFFLFLISIYTISSNDDFDRAPSTPVNYRYFGEADQTFKILGSCDKLKTTAPMSRCVLKLIHKYKLKYISVTFTDLVVTGIVIHKSNENGQSYVIILTAFHIAVPQLDLSLSSFMLIYYWVFCLVMIPLFIYYYSVIYHYLCKFISVLMIYAIISSCFVYCIMLFQYPFFFNSLFVVNVLLDKKHVPYGKLITNCRLISSNLVFSSMWWEDLSFIKCLIINEDMSQFIEVCTPIREDTTLALDTPVNVIGYVGSSPTSFDVIMDPFFPSLSPLITVDSIEGKTPSNLLHAHTFMNCTGTLRLTDKRKMYIDTPSTYGFSGGPCFSITNTNPWSFYGIFIGTSRLWNVCTRLTESAIFWIYYDEFTKTKTLNNMKNEL